MAYDDVRRVLREMKHESVLYARKTTELSDLLDEVEFFLQELPGKAGVEVLDTGQAGARRLAFNRYQNKWRLLYVDTTTGQWVPVTQASVPIKAKALAILPRLLDEIRRVQSDVVENVERGLQGLSQIRPSEKRGDQ